MLGTFPPSFVVSRQQLKKNSVLPTAESFVIFIFFIFRYFVTFAFLLILVIPLALPAPGILMIYTILFKNLIVAGAKPGSCPKP